LLKDSPPRLPPAHTEKSGLEPLNRWQGKSAGNRIFQAKLLTLNFKLIMNKILVFIISFSAFQPFLFSQVPDAGSVPDEEAVKDCFWSKVLNTPKEKRLSVGLALSGGGAKGFAHVGVIDVLSDSGFPIDYISGTSMGSVVGGLYAAGYGVDKLWGFGRNIEKLKISRDFSKINVISLVIREKLIDPINIRKFIDESFGDKNFEELKIPFSCAAMDIKTGEKIVFSRGPVSIAIKASVNLPGIFKPIEYKHRYLVDGGVVDFLPVDSLKEMGAGWVLASVAESASRDMPDNILTTLMQVIDIRGGLLAQKSKDESDFIIYPEVSDIKVMEFDKCVYAGEEAMKETYGKMGSIKEKYMIDNLRSFPEGI